MFLLGGLLLINSLGREFSAIRAVGGEIGSERLKMELLRNISLYGGRIRRHRMFELLTRADTATLPVS